MFKSTRRNNKGLKIKHVIQISMLLGVSIWLLYQIHHSDDKKSSVTTHKLNNDSGKDINKLGRKVLRPKVKETKEHHQADDEQNNENKGSEDGEDHDEVENEHTHGKEDSEEIKELENDEQVAVIANIEKKMSPSEDDDDGGGGGGDDQVDDTRSSKQPSVDHNEHNSKMQTAQQIDSAPDSYSYESNTAKHVKSIGDDSDSEAQSKKDDVLILEEEKDALTDLETLPDSGTGGSINHENAATN